MNYHAETLGDRITRLLGPALKNPEKTRAVLARLTNEQRRTPQPLSLPKPLQQGNLFEED
jgi:hypothetical protein